MVWIKICGITCIKDAEAVSSMGADCLGFIFSTESPRRIDMDRALNIIKGPVSALKAGVFVNEKIERILKYIKRLDLDYIQLSGDEGVSYMEELKQAVPDIGIIKALRIKKDHRGDNHNIADDFLKYADHILLDSYHSEKYGGTGKTIYWQGVKGLLDPGRLIISGGLDNSNVSRALGILNPFGVDASSRLESSPGQKDLDRVHDFITAVREFEYRQKEDND